MEDQWTISEIEDALLKLPDAPAKCRYYYDKHRIPYITLTVKVRGDLYVKAKLSEIDFTQTLAKVLSRLFHLKVPLNETQKRLDEVIGEFATFEENKYQKTLNELEEKDQKINIIKSAFGDGDLSKYRRYLPENDIHNTYISWWTETASKITAAYDIAITEKDLTDFIRGELNCPRR